MSTWTDAVARLRSGAGYEAWCVDTGRYDATREDYADWLDDSARRSTPGTAQPRVWVLPSIPEDVKHLSAVGGDLIARRDAEDGRYWEIYSALTGRCLVPYMSTRQLVAEYSPLTEVVS